MFVGKFVLRGKGRADVRKAEEKGKKKMLMKVITTYFSTRFHQGQCKTHKI